MTEASPAPAGVLVIDKPLHVTSMGVCRLVRGRLVAAGAPKRIKVGHGGTLDPLATGVLVVLVGRATRLCERVMGGEKGYTTTIDLSRTSESHDLERETVSVSVATPPTRHDVAQALERFVGVIDQVPPAHSAVKIAGRRAYQAARLGESPEIAPKPVRVDAIEITAYEWPSLKIEIRSGRGFYVRSLARDLGEALGVGGVLTALRRTRVGAFTLETSITPEALPDPLPLAALPPPPEWLLNG
ncbi:MAG: tRNA pseudouridine(55) synthase TruB [Planctomycetota bacterium]